MLSTTTLVFQLGTETATGEDTRTEDVALPWAGQMSAAAGQLERG